ncbi:SRPBCC family protein [Streptomyces puniciscabiei]
MTNQTAEHVPVSSITKSVTIDRPVDEVFDYLANLANWRQWAIVNVRSIEPSEQPGWWNMETPHGSGQLRIRSDAATGLLDHDWRDPQAAWTVPARVVANGRGTEFLLTLFRPDTLDEEEFVDQANVLDIELANLKKLLEAKPQQ